MQHLNQVLERARRDHNAPVSLRAVKSLEEIAGQANLYNGDVQPLVDAMSYPDRLVRFEAAIAAGSALPQKPFKGQEQVVPILAESIAQTGKATALVLSGDQDQFNKLVEQLKAGGYSRQRRADTPEAAINTVGADGVGGCGDHRQLPAVSTKLPPSDSSIWRRSTTGSRNWRKWSSRPRSAGMSYAVMTVTNPLLNVTTAKEGAAPRTGTCRKPATAAVRLPLDEKTAQHYALRCASLLGKLAISRGQVLNLLDALPTLAWLAGRCSAGDRQGRRGCARVA